MISPASLPFQKILPLLVTPGYLWLLLASYLEFEVWFDVMKIVVSVEGFDVRFLDRTPIVDHSAESQWNLLRLIEMLDHIECLAAIDRVIQKDSTWAGSFSPYSGTNWFDFSTFSNPSFKEFIGDSRKPPGIYAFRDLSSEATAENQTVSRGHKRKEG